MGKSVNQYETKTPSKAGGVEQTVDIEQGIVTLSIGDHKKES